nr:Sec-independent protein translocase component TatC [Lithodesmioides sp. mgcode 4]
MSLNYFIELKNRLILISGMWSCLIIVSYTNKETLLFIIVSPWLTLINLDNSVYFISTNLTEIFVTYMQISYFISNQLTFIYILYHMIVFVIPGLYCKEYKLIKNKYFAFTLIFLFFVNFFNKLIVPNVCSFFLKLQKILNNQIFTLYFEAKINEYLNLYIVLYKFCFFFFCSFITLLTLSEYLISNNSLSFSKNYRKYYYLLFISISTFISPPDFNFQLLISGIFILFYEIFSILIIFKKNFKQTKI